MHLAVKSTEKLGSTRPVRALLMKGANPNIKDNKGNRPIDYIATLEDGDFNADLTMLLKENSLPSCISDGPLRKVTPSKKTAILYFVFQIFGLVC